VKGPDGKMVILLNANEGWDLSWDFCFSDLSLGQVRCFPVHEEK